jgi:2-octaprenylphenol hydroxylase
MTMSTDFDVIIIGGGPVGAAAAALFAREASIACSRIALIAPDLQESEADSVAGGPAAADAPPTLRVSAIARASQKILQRADAWHRIPAARLAPYERMRVWHASMPPDSTNTLTFDAAELAEPDLGAIVENQLLTCASLQSLRTSGGALIAGAMQHIEVGLDCARVQYAPVGADTEPLTLSARLIVGADGARSAVREQLSIRARTHQYEQRAIVANVRSERPHQRTAWQRFLPSGPVALLPLFNGQCSIVWSADEPLARELMALAPEEFNARLTAASDRVLGMLELQSERAAFPLAQISAEAMIAPRAAITGDAAHQIHPLAGQGVNLGFLDVAALCDAIRKARAEGEDIGALRALRPYEQARYTHNLVMSNAMSAFNFAFSRGGLAGEAVAWALGVAGNITPLRQFFARQAMGTA